MIILTPSTDPQELRFIPRSYVGDSIIFHDESENTDETKAATLVQDDYYLTTDLALELIDGRFYTIKVMNGTDVIFRDKVFCTSQVVIDYTINKDLYTAHSTSNEFIVI